MGWFKTGDGLHAHRKTRRAGLEAMGLWIVAASWSSQQLTEGFIPQWFVDGWPRGRTLARHLLDAGLWTCAVDDGEAGWQFHDWLDYNPSAEQERARKDAAAERQRRARDKAVTRDKQRDVGGDDMRDVLVPRPGPTRPVGAGGADAPTRAHEEVSSTAPATQNFIYHEKPKCPRHTDFDFPPNCGACMRLREEWERWRQNGGKPAKPPVIPIQDWSLPT